MIRKPTHKVGSDIQLQALDMLSYTHAKEAM